jgi:hypothetical protein
VSWTGSTIRLARSFDVHALQHQHRLPAPIDPHWTLETLGIVPEAQGRGPGTRLLVPGLVRADWDALPSQLTMAGAIASGFYPRLGFEVEHDALRWSGPTSWACVERPTSPDSPTVGERWRRARVLVQGGPRGPGAAEGDVGFFWSGSWYRAFRSAHQGNLP